MSLSIHTHQQNLWKQLSAAVSLHCNSCRMLSLPTLPPPSLGRWVVGASEGPWLEDLSSWALTMLCGFTRTLIESISLDHVTSSFSWCLLEVILLSQDCDQNTKNKHKARVRQRFSRNPAGRFSRWENCFKGQVHISRWNVLREECAETSFKLPKMPI